MKPIRTQILLAKGSWTAWSLKRIRVRGSEPQYALIPVYYYTEETTVFLGFGLRVSGSMGVGNLFHRGSAGPGVSLRG